MQRSKQISESLELGILLALSGGFMDAYSYMCRGEVFANAQTGNIVLTGIYFSEGNMLAALRYLCPVLSFVLGIAIADIVRYRFKDADNMHWRQITVLFEALVLLFVSFLSLDRNLLANSLTSFACGIQVESFRKIKGNGIATTMCIGNLRTATQAVSEYQFTKNKKMLKRGLLYYGVILSFATGAIIGNICVKLWNQKAIMVCSGLLGIGFLMMFIRNDSDSLKS